MGCTRLARRWSLLLLAVIVVPAIHCASDPNVQLFPSYEQAARRILAGHQQMGLLFRDINTTDGGADADDAVAKIKETVIPGLDKLAKDANSLNLESAPVLKQLNDSLVAALLKKKQGYEEMAAAYQKQDPDAFKNAKQKVLQATQEIVNYEQQLTELRTKIQGY